jgi:predicted lipoprotein with Yx(FWY)xxD motif
MRHREILLAGAMLALSSCDTILPPPAPPPGPIAPAIVSTLTLSTATKDPFGTYVTDGAGRSLYILEGTRGGSGINRCSGACLGVWPPLAAPALPTAGSGLNPPALRTTSGYRGAQISYSGWPLYYYHHDRVPGDTTGQGVRDAWGTWYLLRSDGEPIRPVGGAAY